MDIFINLKLPDTEMTQQMFVEILNQYEQNRWHVKMLMYVITILWSWRWHIQSYEMSGHRYYLYYYKDMKQVGRGIHNTTFYYFMDI